MKRLPDAEFDIMKEVWKLDPPITSGMLLESLVGERGKDWKLQTLHTLLGRLVDRGFLRFEKKGKEKSFFPLVERDEYLKYETKSFVQQYHEGSLLNLVNAAYQGERLCDADIDELVKWATDQRRDKV
jgi:BlaI family penicillinase repressor